MTDDLRALAERIAEASTYYRASRSEVGTLVRGYLTLLSSLEAREVELRMLKRSNTVLNERLEAAERRAEKAESMLLKVDTWLLAKVRALLALEGRGEKP